MTTLESSFVLPRLLLLAGILLSSIVNSDGAASSLRQVQPSQDHTNNVVLSRELSGDNGTLVSSDPKIIGGTDVNSTAMYPYFASTAYPSPYICGATLVAPDVLLTAAHCSVAFPVGVGAIVGTNKYRQVVPGSVLVNVTQQVIHPQYVNFLNYDLMLLKISPPVFSIRPIALQWNVNWPSTTAAAKNMTIMGFGLTMDQVSSSIPTTLQAATGIPEVPYTTCKSIWSPVTTNDICAENKSPLRVTCQGDSGGPLIAYTVKGMPIQVGTVSYGGVSCTAGPGVNTRLTSYENFLKGTVCSLTNYPPKDFQCVLIATDLPADGSGNATNTYAYSGGSGGGKKNKKNKKKKQQTSTTKCSASGTACRQNKQCCSGKCKKGACN